MKENSMSYRPAKQEIERLICEIEEITITHRAYTAECLRRVLKENEEIKNQETIETVLSMLKEKDKQIDLMAEYISNITDCPFESEGKYLDCEKMCDVRTDKECWKQYFENKAKERR